MWLRLHAQLSTHNLAPKSGAEEQSSLMALNRVRAQENAAQVPSNYTAIKLQ